MRRAEYARRKAARICAYSMGCTEKSLPKGGMCKAHKPIRAAECKKANEANYFAKKARGQCVSRGCKNDATDETVTCGDHRETARQVGIKRRAAPKYKAEHTKYQRRRRKKRIKQGSCVRCNEPLITKTLCEAHRLDVLKKWRLRHPRKPGARVVACSGCGSNEHLISTCEQGSGDVVPLRIEDFIYRRTSDPLQESQEPA